MITKEKINELIAKNEETEHAYRNLRDGADFDVDGYAFSYVLNKRGYRDNEHNTYTLIFKLSKSGQEDTFWQETGYYGSYSGTDWNMDFDQVEPFTETIVYYKEV